MDKLVDLKECEDWFSTMYPASRTKRLAMALLEEVRRYRPEAPQAEPARPGKGLPDPVPIQEGPVYPPDALPVPTPNPLPEVSQPAPGAPVDALDVIVRYLDGRANKLEACQAIPVLRKALAGAPSQGRECWVRFIDRYDDGKKNWPDDVDVRPYPGYVRMVEAVEPPQGEGAGLEPQEGGQP